MLDMLNLLVGFVVGITPYFGSAFLIWVIDKTFLVFSNREWTVVASYGAQVSLLVVWGIIFIFQAGWFFHMVGTQVLESFLTL